MATQENLLGVSRDYFTADIVTKISEIVGLTTENTLKGLKFIVPTCIGGILEKGSTPEGASELVDIVDTHNFEKQIALDVSSLKEGDSVIHNIFGTDFDSTVAKLSSQTKLDRESVTKILSVASTVCMGIVGTKIKNNHLSLNGFMSFIKDQKKLLSGYGRKTSEYYGLSGSSPEKDYAKRFDQSIWQSWIWAAIIIGGTMMIWWNAVQYRSPSTIKTPVTTVTSAPIALLGDFLDSPKIEELPKHFYFDGIHFLGESTRLAEGFEEIKYVAEVLKSHPQVKVRLVGIAENVGTDQQTNEFANRRAELVRNELVARGARPEQISTMGLASSLQKMEIIVLGVK